MESLWKLAKSIEAARFDAEDTPQLMRCSSTSKEQSYRIDGVPIPVTKASLPNGHVIPLLKAMLTTACERNCHYCAFRAGRDTRRFSFSPDELASTFMQFYRLGIAKGLFLSTGILNGGIRAEDRLLDTIAILRRKHRFQGYIHIKIMPGAEKDQVYEAMLLADRVSVNLEAPGPEYLQKIAPRKDFQRELIQPILWMDEIRKTRSPQRAWKQRWPSSTTQFVVGPAGETDVDLLQLSASLFQTYHFSRTYFMAFTPIEGTPLETHPAEDPRRQQRLYQASFLLRDYGYHFEELPFLASGKLPIHEDPKIAAARTTLKDAPVGVNTADRECLLRVPGIGPRSAERILQERRRARIRDVSHLYKLGVSIQRAAPYIHFNGTRPSYQMALPGFGR